MSASRGRRGRSSGMVRALFRLALLIGFGFSAGLLIGVLAEEPELLAGHLRGEGEAVVLSETEHEVVMEREVEIAAESPLPEVSAPAPIESPPSVDRKADAPERPEIRPESSAERRWAIQVGAFSEEAGARRLAKELEKKGYPAELLAAEGAGQRWRVRVQPIESEERVAELEDRLKRVERLPTWVISLKGRSGR